MNMYVSWRWLISPVLYINNLNLQTYTVQQIQAPNIFSRLDFSGTNISHHGFSVQNSCLPFLELIIYSNYSEKIQKICLKSCSSA